MGKGNLSKYKVGMRPSEETVQRPKAMNGPGRCSGVGGRRTGEKNSVRGSCCDSEKRQSCEQPRHPVPLTDRRFRKWHAKSPGLELGLGFLNWG